MDFHTTQKIIVTFLPILHKHNWFMPHPYKVETLTRQRTRSIQVWMTSDSLERQTSIWVCSTGKCWTKSTAGSWFDSNHIHQPPVTEMRITHAVRVKLSGHVNDDNIRALDNSSSRFLHQIISPKKPTFISLFIWHAVPFKSGKGESGLLPDRTQGAGVSRRLAGEVCGLT